MNVFFDDRQDIFVISDALKKKIIKCIETALKVENKRMSNIEVSDQSFSGQAAPVQAEHNNAGWAYQPPWPFKHRMAGKLFA